MGCSETWHIMSQSDGVWLMRPYRRHEWSGPGPRIAVVRMPPGPLSRMRHALKTFWAARRVILSPADASRLLAVVNDALRGAQGRLRSELEWAGTRLQQ